MNSLQLATHRREYLEYEGPVSGNRGSVKWLGSAGEYRILEDSPTRLIVRLDDGTKSSFHLRA